MPLSTTIIFQKSFASDATPKRHLMTHQMKNLCGFSVFNCVEGAFGASSGGTPKMKNGAPRDELKNGRGRGWAGPYFNLKLLKSPLKMPCKIRVKIEMAISGYFFDFRA